MAAVVVVPVGPDDGGGAADRNSAAEPVVVRAVAGFELEKLCGVGGVRDIEEVGRAAAVVTIVSCPDDGGFAAHRDGDPEFVIHRAIVGQELGKLIAEVGVGRGGAQDQCCRGKKWRDEMSHGRLLGLKRCVLSTIRARKSIFPL